MGRVLVSVALAGDNVARLRQHHEVVVGPGPTGLGKTALLRQLAGFDGLIAMLTDVVDDELLAAAPRLKVIANHAVGVDNIDLGACRARNIVVTNTPGVLADATADLAFGLLLAAARRIVSSDARARSGAWPGWAPTDQLGKRVTGATLGLVGLGQTGQAVARRAKGFAMRVLYASPRRADEALEEELGARHVTLDELLQASDFVSLHCPLTPETRGLFDKARIARMRRGAVLINTARGPCVDVDALADALATGHLAAAGLDVFDREPLIPERLLGLDNVVLTTHIGSADEASRAAMGRICVDAVLAVLRGEEPLCRVA